MKSLTALLFLAIAAPGAAFAQIYPNAAAQAAQAEELQRQLYLQAARGVDLEVWNRDMPRFSDHAVPPGYEGESAVILALDRDITVTAKKGSGMAKFWSGHGGGFISYTDVNRVLVRIGDRSALDYYSDFDFRQRSESKMGGISNKYTSFMGARIIKPDGQVVHLDIYNDAVKVTEGKDDKEAYHRIAIPDLQIGDLLDYYYCSVLDLDAGDIDDEAILFYTFDYPVLHFSARVSIDGPVTLEYRPINGAPDFERSQTPDGTSVLEVAAENLLRLNTEDHVRWISPLRSLPMIRYSFFQNESKSNLITPGARPAGIHKNVEASAIVEDAAWYLGLQEYTGEKAEIKKDIAAFRAANPSASQTELAQYIADRVAMTWNFFGYLNYYNDRSFAIIMHDLLTGNGIECKVGFVSVRSLSRAHEVFDPTDLRCIVTANDNSQIFVYGINLFNPPAELSGWLAGETAMLYANPTIRKTMLPIKGQGLKGNMKPFTMPLSPDSLNACKTAMTVKFSGSDPSLLEISRNTTCTGEVKREMQPLLLLREDWDREVRSHLAAAKATYLDVLGRKRSTRKYRDGVAARFDKDREKQKDVFKNEVNSFHDAMPENMIGYDIVRQGVTSADPVLEYTSDYTMRGFVRRAGSDIILEIGRIAGVQWAPNDNERNRPIDAWLPCCRRYETEVRIDIPDGYAAAQPGPFDAVENEYGGFSASVTVEGNSIVVRTTKIYKKDHVPAGDFHILLEMIDAANEFYGKSVVLTKTS